MEFVPIEYIKNGIIASMSLNIMTLVNVEYGINRTFDLRNITEDTDEPDTEAVNEPETAAVSLYKRPETTTNHGRIGGDSYVSASSTLASCTRICCC